MKYLSITSTLFIVIYLIGCSDSNNVVQDNNVLSVRSVNDTLAISISTTNYTHNEDIDMYFSVDSINVSLSVAGYGNGSGVFKLFRDSVLVYSKDISSNIQSIREVLRARPTKASISLSNYRAAASILVTK